MDCQMPGMDGFEATRRFRAGGRTGLPIIALTAAAGGEDRQLAMEAGMDDFLSKPVCRRELREVLARWIIRPESESVRKPGVRDTGKLPLLQ
jgi:CheY-like chemotaxis protein